MAKASSHFTLFKDKYAAWCHANDKTLINGAKIYTGSITADKINVADLFAQNIDATGSISGLKYLSSGRDSYNYPSNMSLDGGCLNLTSVDGNVTFNTNIAGHDVLLEYLEKTPDSTARNFVLMNGNGIKHDVSRDSLNYTTIFKTTEDGVEVSNLDVDGDLIVGGVDILEEIVDIFTSVKRYGAKGDGTTDDTTAIQSALAENRKVYIPAGTYKLSGELVIRDNCELTLAQDTVLNFTQTSGNCISMKMSASIMGHHGTVNVPYGFTGNGVYISSTLNPDTNSVIGVPPWSKWTPQWKTGRYIKDLNICKPDSRGFHYSMGGSNPCSGTGIYISADSSTTSSFIWGLNFSGIRIAGAFTYGIKAKNFNDGWNHEMRIEAFLDACETAVSIEDCNQAYLSVVVQPREAMDSNGNYSAYAKCGIELIRSKRTDLHGSRVWDWNADNSLWEYEGRYQHIAMIGDCTGTVLDDYCYWAMSNWDIRKLIYTDTPSNLEKMTIIQEPITRWFKVTDSKPYFNDGATDRPLITKQDLEAHFITDVYPNFTNVLSEASDGAGNVFNKVGYMARGGYIASGSGGFVSSTSYGCTGYIPCKVGDVIRVSDINFDHADDLCSVVLYDQNFNRILNVDSNNFIGGGSYYVGYVATDYGFDFTIKNVAANQNTAYIRISFRAEDIGSNPEVAVNEAMEYTAGGFLADGIRVKKEYVVGLDKTALVISSSSTDAETPTAKAVYDAIQTSLGVIENGTY